ncbi:MAG: hypothetical protein IH857_04370 [Deltaproteobacteria bacterium]|nr:hypothetical protein [Deltaproteobacteria bacterium]MCZ6625351.1 hypothetical protein [Deltaproteobacteria bacterium]
MVYASAYAQTLRAVGQSLEARHLEDFDLECHEDAFLVRSNERPPSQRSNVLQEILRAPQELSILQVILRKLHRPRARPLELRYTREDVERLDLEGQLKRRDPHGIPDFYSLSQILRTVGAYIDLKNSRLLGVYKRGVRLTIECEQAQGQRNTEEHTIPSFYDFFLHMYQHRSDRWPG